MTKQIQILITEEQKNFALQGMEKLTPREWQILNDLLNNNTSKEIGRKRNISFRTAEVHRSNIMLKLGTRRLVEVMQILYALATEPNDEPHNPASIAMQ